ncbi:MAG: hypothetical protein HY060_24510 [Proteobacteria bacterium]|nr:hypothetical protein [Pseudomonadota bacterium]
MSYRPNDPRHKLAGDLLKGLGERESPERRGGPRFLAPPLDVMIDRKRYQTLDWGLGALVIGGYDGPLKADAKITVTVSRAEEPEIAHKAKGRVLRIDKKRRQLTLQFTEVGKGMLGWLGDLQMTGGATGVTGSL